MRNFILNLSLCLFFASCLPQESVPTSSSLYVAAGDILVSSSVNDTVHQFDSSGNYIRALWRTTLASETIGSIGWMHSTNEILISIDGTPDRVVAVSVVDGRERVLINNTNITGTIRGAIQLADTRDILVSELTAIERTTESGIRETFTGVWPSTVTTNIQSMIALEAGGFATASSTTGVRLFPDSTAAFAASATAAAPAGTTGSYGVVQLSNGNFAAAWEGAATDIIELYDSSLTSISTLFANNQGLLQAPRGLAIKKNGNLLVSDNTLDYVLEIDSSGNVVRTLGTGGSLGGLLDGAYSVFVVPDYTP